MNLSEALLQRLSEWSVVEERQTLLAAVEGSSWSVSVVSDRNESLSCRVWDLTVRRAPAADFALQPWADGVCKKATGLLEGLRVVEVDAPNHQALLRSEQPTSKGARLAYYEVLLHGSGEASLRRFEAPREPGSRREQVAFALTHEVLAKVAADLIPCQ
jgi:hypothetical protein